MRRTYRSENESIISNGKTALRNQKYVVSDECLEHFQSRSGKGYFQFETFERR